MREVAERASVSVMTVSNVINGRPGAVGSETKARVEQAMAEIGYHPNMSARALRSAQSDTLAFLLRDESSEYLADPLTNLLTAGIGEVLREHDRNLLIRTVRAESDPEGLFEPLLQSRVDGAFVLLSGEPDMRRWSVQRLTEIDVPFVVFDEVLDDPQVLSVRAADRDGGRVLTEHLMGRGHRRIGFIGARVPWAVLEQRRLGHADALRSAGIEPVDELQVFDAGWQPAGAAAMVDTLLALPDPPTAIMCGSDVLAIGAIQTLKRRGLRVPDDIAVTGFDDFTFAEFVEPALTTVRVPALQMGRMAAGMLLREIEGAVDVRQVVLPVELVVRASG